MDLSSPNSERHCYISRCPDPPQVVGGDCGPTMERGGTFIHKRKNKNKKQKRASRQQKSLIQPPGNPTNGAASVYLVGIPLFSEKQLAMVRELLFPSVSGD